MTMMEFVGCACTAYGAPLAMFIFTIMRDPIRIIILIASAFFWLLSLLLSSILWHALPSGSPLFFGVAFSVVLQEVFRYLIYVVLRKAETGLKKVYVPNTNTEITNNKHMLSYVAGLGFGLMSGAFSLVNVLAQVVGPGTMGTDGSSHYFCVISAAFTLCFVLLHTFWSIIFFSAVDSGNYILVSWVVGSHMLVSCLTLMNQLALYAGTLLPAYAVLCITMYIAFRVCGGTYHRFYRTLCRARHADPIVPNTD